MSLLDPVCGKAEAMDLIATVNMTSILENGLLFRHEYFINGRLGLLL